MTENTPQNQPHQTAMQASPPAAQAQHELKTELTAIQALEQALKQLIIGQDDTIESLMIALLAGGHVLLEGPPGLAKTTLVHALASGIHADFARIQFTPDLMPSDLTGSEIYEPASSGFHFVPGPLFNHIILADEINRAPPKVQSALLEAMAEQQISAGGQSHRLPELFMVLATQNPLEQAGTYILPEAQRDRFLLHLLIDYPQLDDEIRITRQARQATQGHIENAIDAQIHPEQLLALRQQTQHIHIDPRLEQHAVQLVAATRQPGQYLPQRQDSITIGASPRGSIALQRCAMARALLQGRDHVLPEDLHHLAPKVLRHRLVLSYSAQSQGLSPSQLIEELIQAIPPT